MWISFFIFFPILLRALHSSLKALSGFAFICLLLPSMPSFFWRYHDETNWASRCIVGRDRECYSGCGLWVFCIVFLWEHHVTIEISNSLVFHADVTDTVGTTTITVTLKENLIKMHVDKLNREKFLRLENSSVRGRFDYDKGESTGQ